MSSSSAAAIDADLQPKSRRRRYVGRFLNHLFGNFGWPILFRELSADFRKNRFLLSYSLSLCLLGTVVLVLVATAVEDVSSTPTQIGRKLFSIFFVAQYTIILLLFPAFSCISFAEERNRFTLDLLLTSTLRPRDIVWGKFLSATVYCLLFVIASIPLMSVAFLFGGIRPVEVLFAYLFLIASTLLISMLGVCISSCMRTTLGCIVVTYILVHFVVKLPFTVLIYQALVGDPEGDSSVPRDLLATFGWGNPGFYWLMLASLMLFVAVFSYLFIITTNRIRPPADNKATALRVLTFVSSLLILVSYAWYRWSGGALEASEDVVFLVFPVMLIVAWVFPTEEAYVSRRNQRAFSSWTGWRYPFRIFAPGAFWGFLYVVCLSVLICGGLYALWSTVEGQFDVELAQSSAIKAVLVTLPFYLAAVAASGFFLGACDFSPMYARLTVIFVFIITLLLPVIFALSEQKDALWTFYYLSPITLWWSLNPDPHDETEITYELYGLPVIHIAKAVFFLLAICFFWAGVRQCRRAGYPILRFGAWRDVHAKKPRGEATVARTEEFLRDKSSSHGELPDL